MTRGVLLSAGLLVAFAWFYQAGGWNQNSRFDLTRAIVEEGTLTIDSYHENTGDKARHDGHVYSDKAPGLALTALPMVAAARPLTGTSPSGLAWLTWLATVWVAALPTALTALLIILVARRAGATEGGAVFGALVFGLATPAWAYATLFFGHALATFCLFGAFAAALTLGERPLLMGLLVGIGGGWASVTEYPSAPPAAILCGLALAVAARPVRARVAAGILAGGLVAACALVGYNLAAFGSAFQTGYTHVEGFSGMKEGVMGVTYPKLDVLFQISFGSYRGLFFFAPVLVAAPFGFFSGVGPRRVAAVAGAIVLYYFLFNASYRYWHGGWSYGPRHMAPALPFLASGLACLWSRARRPLRALLLAGALVSGALTLVAVSTTAQPPGGMRQPLGTLLWPAFRDGDLSLNHQSFLDTEADPDRLRGRSLPRAAWNLGEKLGLSGHASLAPLLLVLGLCGVLAWRAGRPHGTVRHG